jgi:PAS domain S-box-containing protein
MTAPAELSHACPSSRLFAELMADPAIRDAAWEVVFDHCPVGVAFVDPDGRMSRANPAFGEMTGYTVPELQGRTWMDMTVAEDVAADLAQFERLKAGDISDYPIHKRYRHRLGSVVPVRLSVFPVLRDREFLFCVAFIERPHLDPRYTTPGENGLRPVVPVGEFLVEAARAHWGKLSTAGLAAVTALWAFLSSHFRTVERAEFMEAQEVELRRRLDEQNGELRELRRDLMDQRRALGMPPPRGE